MEGMEVCGLWRVWSCSYHTVRDNFDNFIALSMSALRVSPEQTLNSVNRAYPASADLIAGFHPLPCGWHVTPGFMATEKSCMEDAQMGGERTRSAWTTCLLVNGHLT